MDKDLERWQQFMNAVFVTYQAKIGRKLENREFAHLLGVDPSWTSRWIKGTAENVPGDNLLDQVAAGLELLHQGWGVFAYVAAGKPVKAPPKSRAANITIFLSMLDQEGVEGFEDIIRKAAVKKIEEKGSTFPIDPQLLTKYLQLE